MLDYKIFSKISDVLTNNKISTTKALKISKELCELIEREVNIPVVNRPNYNAAKNLKTGETEVGPDGKVKGKPGQEIPGKGFFNKKGEFVASNRPVITSKEVLEGK